MVDDIYPPSPASNTASPKGFKASIQIAALLAGTTLAFVLAVALIVLAGLPERAAFTGQFSSGQIAIAPEIGALPPPFTLPSLRGETLDLISLRGSPVIINFWATWCEPCVVEMPELQAVYLKYQARGLRIVGVNLGETSETVKAWGEALGLTFDMVLDERQKAAERYYLRGQPSTYVVSRGGIITDIFYGPVSQGQLEAALMGVLTEDVP